MSEITKCADHKCPARGNCLRFTAPAAPEQSFADYGRGRPYGQRCADYIQVTDRDKRPWLAKGHKSATPMYSIPRQGS
mgnify:CR=1 FL=1